jgi:hypothetical protein
MHRTEPRVLYGVPRGRIGWELSEETMPESVVHDDAVDLLRALLKWWARDRNVQVARNLAIRWDEAHPNIGVDPDVCLLAAPGRRRRPRERAHLGPWPLGPAARRGSGVGDQPQEGLRDRAGQVRRQRDR